MLDTLPVRGAVGREEDRKEDNKWQDRGRLEGKSDRRWMKRGRPSAVSSAMHPSSALIR